jgi:glyoxylase-like metal-dependent hydrolase (beta-lactamase superfamily II)
VNLCGHFVVFRNRKTGSNVIRVIAPIAFGFGKSKRFVPDLCIGNGYALSAHGFDATVLAIPGHSRGSVGILTAGGGFFCGDLFDNSERPVLNSIMDDAAAASASVEKLKNLAINTVYPGHGNPFPMEQFLESNR